MADSIPPRTHVASLVVEPEVIEARYGSETQNHAFRLRNTGTVPVNIIEITTTCGCTSVSGVPERAIEPNQESVVKFEASPAPFGEKTSYLTVHTDPILAKPIIITVKLKGEDIPVPFVSHAPEVVTLSGTEYASEAVSEFEVQTVELAQSPLFLSRNQCDLDGLRIWFEGDPREEPLFDGKVRRIYKLKVMRRLPESDIQVTKDRHVIATAMTATRPPKTVTIEARVTLLVKIVPSFVNLTVRRNAGTPTECMVAVIDSRGESERAPLVTKVDADWIRVERQTVVTQPDRSV